MSTRRLMSTLAMQLGTASVFFVPACGGHSLELDRVADAMPPDADATAPFVETIPIPDPIRFLFVDETRLYWLTGAASFTKFQSCLKSNCAQTIITYAAEEGPVLLMDAAVAPGRVYWAFSYSVYSCPSTGCESPGYTVYSCPSAGCESAPTRVVSDPYFLTFSLSADEDYAYWASESDIYRCKYSGCGPVPELVAPRQRPWSQLAFQGPNVYWSDREGHSADESAPAAHILYAPKDGSAPPAIFSPADTSGVVTDSTSVYWIDDAGSGALLACPLAGCGAEGPVTLATHIPQHVVLAVDASGLYWNPDGSIHFCPLKGCASNAKAITVELPDPPIGVQTQGQSGGVVSFAVDDQYVYWTIGQNISRMPKP